MSDLPKRCQSVYAGNQCSFVLGHDHPHGTCDSDIYVTWGRMASDQQPSVGGFGGKLGRWNTEHATPSSDDRAYRPLDRNDTLAECADCGAVVQGDVVGQNRHDIWHEQLDDRIADARRWRPAPRIGGHR